jgi:hypothetical protein
MKEDASAFMKGAISRNELWDLVVLDPPKLAPRKKVHSMTHLVVQGRGHLSRVALHYLPCASAEPFIPSLKLSTIQPTMCSM